MDAGAKVFTTRWLPVGRQSLEYDRAILAGLGLWALDGHDPRAVLALTVAATTGALLSMATKDRAAALGLPPAPERALGWLLGGRDGRLLLVAVGALLGAPIAALAAVTTTSALVTRPSGRLPPPQAGTMTAGGVGEPTPAGALVAVPVIGVHPGRMRFRPDAHLDTRAPPLKSGPSVAEEQAGALASRPHSPAGRAIKADKLRRGHQEDSAQKNPTDRRLRPAGVAAHARVGQASEMREGNRSVGRHRQPVTVTRPDTPADPRILSSNTRKNPTNRRRRSPMHRRELQNRSRSGKHPRARPTG